MSVLVNGTEIDESEIAAEMEQGARAADRSRVAETLEQMRRYLDRLRVVY